MKSVPKSIATLLTVWLTVFSHIALALPVCQQSVVQAQEQVSAQTHSHHGNISATDDRDKQEGPQQKHDGTGGLSCGACVACHALAPVASTTVSVPNRVFVSASPARFLSFTPQQPQPIPIVHLV
jgi:hypothetical protein